MQLNQLFYTLQIVFFISTAINNTKASTTKWAFFLFTTKSFFFFQFWKIKKHLKRNSWSMPSLPHRANSLNPHRWGSIFMYCFRSWWPLMATIISSIDCFWQGVIFARFDCNDFILGLIFQARSFNFSSSVLPSWSLSKKWICRLKISNRFLVRTEATGE